MLKAYIIGLILVTMTDSSQVKHVHVMFRHGDRTPITLFPKIQGLTPQDWPQGPGQLTKIGMQQQFNLGRFLRSRYNHLLSKNYDRRELRVRSSNFDRTLMSAQANLAGLYWNLSSPEIPEIAWQLIPIHTVDKESDSLLLGTKCPKRLKYGIINSKHFDEMMTPADLAVLKTVSSYPGWGHFKGHTSWSLSDAVFCAKSHNKTLSNLITEPIWRGIQRIDALGWRERYLNETMLRLKTGVLLGAIRDHFVDISSIKSVKHRLITGRKMVIYSAHDTDSAALLGLLGAYNWKQPSYANAILLELSQTNYKWMVELYYRNDTSKDPYRLDMALCPYPCLLTTFIRNVRKKTLSLEEFRSECALSESQTVDLIPAKESKKSGLQVAVWTFVAIICFGLVCVLTGIAAQLFRKSRSVQYSSLQMMES